MADSKSTHRLADDASSLNESSLSMMRRAFLALKKGQYGNARALAEAILESNPHNPDALHMMGLISYQLNEFEQAVDWFDKAIARKSADPVFYYNKGNALRKMGAVEASIVAHDHALSIKPNYSDAYHARGLAQKIMGQTTEAVESYKRALEYNPKFYKVYWGLATLKKATESDNTITQIEALLKKEQVSALGRVHCYFSLAKQYDDLGIYEKAAHFYVMANKFKRTQIKYQVAEDSLLMRAMREAITPNFIKRHQGVGSDSFAPIFIVGLPRSGSSLLEQVLASHPMIHGGGELLTFSNLVSQLISFPAGLDDIKKVIAGMSAEDIRKRAEVYLEQVQGPAKNHLFVTDKMLFNFKYIGLIKVFFPNAMVLHIRRHPMASVWACFSQLFADGNKFSYDLNELARYYQEYSITMKYWHELLPGFVQDVVYEDLIADLKGTLTPIFQRCDLDWDEHCGLFYETKRVVNTASATQVRQPIYTSSVDHWHHYSALLEPIREIVERSTS